jgi:hypothetical protein
MKKNEKRKQRHTETAYTKLLTFPNRQHRCEGKLAANFRMRTAMIAFVPNV